MDSKSIVSSIESIERDVFDFAVGKIPNDVVNLFSGIIEGGLSGSAVAGRLAELNMLMGEALAAMQNHDYLLLADLLRYRLLPLLGGEIH